MYNEGCTLSNGNGPKKTQYSRPPLAHLLTQNQVHPPTNFLIWPCYLFQKNLNFLENYGDDQTRSEVYWCWFCSPGISPSLGNALLAVDGDAKGLEREYIRIVISSIMIKIGIMRAIICTTKVFTSAQGWRHPWSPPPLLPPCSYERPVERPEGWKGWCHEYVFLINL